MTRETITLKAAIESTEGRALDPQNHDSALARDIARELCEAMTESYARYEHVGPETLAIAAQTMIETLISGIEREGVNCASMRVALANSLLVNGDAAVEIAVNGRSVPSILSEGGNTIH